MTLDSRITAAEEEELTIVSEPILEARMGRNLDLCLGNPGSGRILHFGPGARRHDRGRFGPGRNGPRTKSGFFPSR